MFDMRLVGQTINELRKKADMTQMELADRLGISYQAVSNWERGTSMPDISKLPDLAELFGVSVDTILGNSASAGLLHSLIEDNVETYLEAHAVGVDEVAEVAPILKPAQTEEMVNRIGVPNRLTDLVGLAPFLGREFLDPLAVQADAEGDYDGLVGLAPFVSRSVLDGLAESAIGKTGRLNQLQALAPFVSREVLDRLAEQLADTGRPKDIVPLAPFVSRSVLDRLAESAAERGSFSRLEALAPFVSREVLDRLVADSARSGHYQNLMALAPFVSREVLDGLAEQAAANGQYVPLSGLAPFLSQETLASLALRK
ncbi:helix-turn-helix domain-containing protein [Gorillibacterium sp. sgz500922]|uniref:helix-turn-helix domain-containing protein n=1 Tax=Gorillibacterium sp. sgz500922 TaxID=3446694 RepID=UPI003F6687D9